MEKRKRAKKQIIIGFILLVAGAFMYIFGMEEPEVKDFLDCEDAGYLVMESYPRQCKSPDGQTFREDIGNELEKDDMIRIESPRPNSLISSPVIVKGVARGQWFFEATFPVIVVDWDGKIIGEGYATADPEKGKDWMTTDFVPFYGKVSFDKNEISGNYSLRGSLILKKDNPSGLPEHDDALEIPVRFR